ncbi:hypothetical protein F5B17DRAFT_174563 [Nemania serpens]|nr:hypothetical protein F5B17DRAFT_174563 [Nemania serpens]
MRQASASLLVTRLSISCCCCCCCCFSFETHPSPRSTTIFTIIFHLFYRCLVIIHYLLYCSFSSSLALALSFVLALSFTIGCRPLTVTIIIS